MRAFIAMPHFFEGSLESAENRSRQVDARQERLRALIAAISSLHQSLGNGTFGLDHGQRMALPMPQQKPHTLDLVIVTTGESHLLNEIKPLWPMFRHYATMAIPTMLGFECHKLCAMSAAT